jgi:hypothetical protein
MESRTRQGNGSGSIPVSISAELSHPEADILLHTRAVNIRITRSEDYLLALRFVESSNPLCYILDSTCALNRTSAFGPAMYKPGNSVSTTRLCPFLDASSIVSRPTSSPLEYHRNLNSSRAEESLHFKIKASNTIMEKRFANE